MEEMTKEQIVTELRKKKYNVKLENGVIMLIYDNDCKPDLIENYLTELEKMEYHCSFGYRGKTGIDKQNFDEVKKDVES